MAGSLLYNAFYKQGSRSHYDSISSDSLPGHLYGFEILSNFQPADTCRLSDGTYLSFDRRSLPIHVSFFPQCNCHMVSDSPSVLFSCHRWGRLQIADRLCTVYRFYQDYFYWHLCLFTGRHGMHRFAGSSPAVSKQNQENK